MKRRALIISAAAATVAAVAIVVYLAWPESKVKSGCDGQSAGCVSVGPGEPLYIGSLLAAEDASGADSLASLGIAIDYLDGKFDGADGRLLGHPVQLISEDDGCSPEGGRLGAERLLQEKKLLGIIGTTCSSAALDEADQLTSARKVLLISPSNSAPGLTDSEHHQRFYFRTALNDLIQSEVAADFAFNKIARRRAAVAYTPDAYSKQLAAGFAERIRLKGATVVAQSDLNAKGGVAAALRQAAAGNADVVFIPVLESSKPACSEVVSAIQSVPALSKAAIIVSEGCQTRDFLKKLGAKADGVYASGPDSSDIIQSRFYRDEFLPAFKRQSGSGPQAVFAPNAFDAANLLFSAIRRSSRGEPGGGLLIDRDKLRSAMLDVNGYGGLSGNLTCGPTGDCAQGAKIAIFQAPQWPVADPSAKPVFTRYKTIAELRAGP